MINIHLVLPKTRLEAQDQMPCFRVPRSTPMQLLRDFFAVMNCHFRPVIDDECYLAVVQTDQSIVLAHILISGDVVEFKS